MSNAIQKARTCDQLIDAMDDEQELTVREYNLVKTAWQAALEHAGRGWVEPELHGKPTKTGRFIVRGFDLSDPLREAVVEVACDDGVLVCNLNDSNTDEVHRYSNLLSEISDSFEWAPLYTQPPAPVVPNKLDKFDGYVPPEDGSAGEYYVEGWNDCRAAMLDATPNTGDSEAPSDNTETLSVIDIDNSGDMETVFLYLSNGTMAEFDPSVLIRGLE